MLVIEQITPVKLLINVSEPYFPKVTKGMIVKVKFDVYGDEAVSYTHLDVYKRQVQEACSILYP